MPELSLVPESLSTLAELGIGLAGFSSIVVVLGGQALSLDPLDRARVYGLLQASFAVSLLSVWPIVLADAGVSEAMIWRVASATACPLFAGMLLLALNSTRYLPLAARRKLHPAMWVLIVGGSAISLLAMLCNAIAWPFPPSPAPYLYCLVYLLFYGGVQFLRVLLVRPAGPMNDNVEP
jgi:hypothetical protein